MSPCMIVTNFCDSPILSFGVSDVTNSIVTDDTVDLCEHFERRERKYWCLALLYGSNIELLMMTCSRSLNMLNIFPLAC